MAITPNPRDTDGVLLQSNITALTASIAATTSPQHKYAMQQQLDSLQQQLVSHFLNVRRLSAASILSTMT